MYIVIRAGGIGSRLWPVSREHNPKQFHALTSANTMLEESISRVQPLAPAEQIFISTNSTAAQTVYEQFDSIPQENIIIEPERKDTAAAIGLESVMIHKRNPNAIVASLGSDHSVRRMPVFQQVLQIAERYVAEYPEHIVAIGVRPTSPDTGYGYIQCSQLLATKNSEQIWKVDNFKEKPNLATAKQYLLEGNYLWNANMFVWNVSTILDLFRKHLPMMYTQLMEIEAAVGTPDEQATIERVYPNLEAIAIDYGIIEKTDSIVAMAADIGWSDIGDWARLKDELAESEAGNVVIGAEHVCRKTENTLVYTAQQGKPVATIGVDNLIIVDTGDALLVCDKYRAQEVKEIVEELKKRKRTDVL